MKGLLGFSYGFRQGRSQHNALDALMVSNQEPTLDMDADIAAFFDGLTDWMLKFLNTAWRISGY
jgi:hypothetical protein